MKDNENKSLLKKQHASDKFYDPLLFNNSFLLCIKIINYTLITFISLTTISYLIIHFYGKMIIRTKSVRLEAENLLYYNLFNNIYLGMIILLAYLTIRRKSLKYFTSYYLLLLTNSILFSIFYFKSGKNIFHNEKIVYFNLIILMVNFIIFTYLIFHFVSLINSNKALIHKNSATSHIVHEILLRSDMMKIQFNGFLIRMKLNKYLPVLLFRKDSFYYTTLSKSDKSDNSYERSLYVDQSTLHKTLNTQSIDSY
jgi:large-conductance mechanosensitive channel